MDAPVEATAWFEKTFDLGAMSTLTLMTGQCPVVLPKVKIAIYRYHQKIGAPVEQFVLVDLSGTTISPGTLTTDQDGSRGAFTDKVQVRVWWEKEDSFGVREAGPPTSAENGSSVKSMSYSISGGFFGDTGTANVGWSISSGVTQQLPDFEILKDVGAEHGKALNSTYRLKTIDGAVYNYPIDAVDLSNRLVRSLPAKACHDLDIYSTVLFHTDQAIGATRLLRVHLSHRVVTVAARFDFLGSGLMVPQMQPYDPKKENQVQQSTIGRLQFVGHITTEPHLAEYGWKFNVDLAQGGASYAGEDDV